MRRRLAFAFGPLWLALVAPVLAIAIASPVAAAASDGAFHLDRLPKGKSVTIPRPATTLVPLTARVVLTATDMPQTVSFRSINVKKGPVSALRLSIYDKDSDRVQYVDVSPSTPFLYAFKELASITVIVESGKTGGVIDGATLQVESNKPLDIAH